MGDARIPGGQVSELGGLGATMGRATGLSAFPFTVMMGACFTVTMGACFTVMMGASFTVMMGCQHPAGHRPSCLHGRKTWCGHTAEVVHTTGRPSFQQLLHSSSYPSTDPPPPLQSEGWSLPPALLPPQLVQGGTPIFLSSKTAIRPYCLCSAPPALPPQNRTTHGG